MRAKKLLYLLLIVLLIAAFAACQASHSEISDVPESVVDGIEKTESDTLNGDAKEPSVSDGAGPDGTVGYSYEYDKSQTPVLHELEGSKAWEGFFSAEYIPWVYNTHLVWTDAEMRWDALLVNTDFALNRAYYKKLNLHYLQGEKSHAYSEEWEDYYRENLSGEFGADKHLEDWMDWLTYKHVIGISQDGEACLVKGFYQYDTALFRSIMCAFIKSENDYFTFNYESHEFSTNNRAILDLHYISDGKYYRINESGERKLLPHSVLKARGEIASFGQDTIYYISGDAPQYIEMYSISQDKIIGSIKMINKGETVENVNGGTITYSGAETFELFDNASGEFTQKWTVVNEGVIAITVGFSCDTYLLFADGRKPLFIGSGFYDGCVSPDLKYIAFCTVQGEGSTEVAGFMTDYEEGYYIREIATGKTLHFKIGETDGRVRTNINGWVKKAVVAAVDDKN